MFSRNRKRTLALLLVAIMILGVLSACNNDSANPSSSAPGSSPSARPTDPALWPTLTIATTEFWADNVSYQDDLPILRQVQEDLGINIVWESLGWEQYMQSMQTRLAAGRDLPDIIRVPGSISDNIKYAQQGLLISMTNLINETNTPDMLRLFEQYPEMRKSLVTPDGEIYFIGNYAHSKPNAMGILYRKDWLDALGMDVPKTTADWYAFMKGMKENDLNGQGAGTIIPFGSQNLHVFITGFGLPFVAVNLYYSYDENGKVLFNSMQPGYKEWLAYCNSLYEAGFLDPMFGAGQSQIAELEKQNLVGVFAENPGAADQKESVLKSLGFDDADVRWEFPPADPNGNVRWAPGPLMRNSTRLSITKDCKDPALAMRFLNYGWANPEGNRLWLFGIEGEHYTMGSNGMPVYSEDMISHPQYALGIRIRQIGGYDFYDLQSLEWNVVRTVGRFAEILNYIETKPQYYYPSMPQLIPTDEESDVVAELSPDITSYIDEMTSRFITGREPISNFDSFVEKLKGLGIESLIDVYQAMYDRYNNS